MTPQDWFNRINCNSLPSLCTAKMQPLALNGLMLLIFRLSDLQTRVCLRVAQHLAVYFPFGASLIDRSTKGKFPSKRRAVPWRSYPMLIIACPRPFAVVAINLLSLALRKGTAQNVVQDKFKTTFNKIERQIVDLRAPQQKC